MWKNLLSVFVILITVTSFGTSFVTANTNDKLIFAASRGDMSAVELLISKGADVNAKDSQGYYTALMAATEQKHKNMIIFLISKGANVNAQLTTGYTALMFAVDTGDADIVNLLIARGADVNETDHYGTTPLMDASSHGFTNIVKLLIIHKANVNAKDKYGSTALMYVVKGNGHTEIVALLKKAGALAQEAQNLIRNQYIGAIGEKYKIYMDLKIANNQLSGYYYYESVGKPIGLEGVIDKNGHFTMTEFSEIDDLKTKTGIFQGTFDTSFNIIQGQWSTMDEKLKLPFKLSAVANNRGSVAFEYPYFLNNPAIQNKLDMLIQKIKHGDYENNELDYNIEYFSNNLISVLFILKFTDPEDRRGNGYLSFNATPVGEIKLSDLFKPESDYRKVLLNCCLTDLKKQGVYLIVDEDQLKQQLDEFNITPRGIKYSFPKCAVSDCAAGSQFVVIPFKDLKQIINSHGPLRYLEKNKDR